MARILSGNALRASRKFIRPVRSGKLRGIVEIGPKLNVRRLIKRDPAKGTSQPFYDSVTNTPGVSGLSGASSVRTMSKARTAAPGRGVKRIPDRGANKTLKKR